MKTQSYKYLIFLMALSLFGCTTNPSEADALAVLKNKTEGLTLRI